MKTIFFVIATPQRVNFILRTDIFRLLNQKSDLRLVIISPFGENSDFVKEFSGANVVFEPVCQLSRLEKTVANWRNEALKINHPVLVASKKIHAFMTRRYVPPQYLFSWLKPFLRKLFLFLIAGPWRKKFVFWDAVEAKFSSNDCCKKLFEKYRPAAVVLASAGAEGADIPFIVYAGKFGAKIFVTDSNIDVFEFRYFSFPRRVTKWALFGEAQKQQAMVIQKIPEGNIAVTGPARYDHYFKKESWLMPRAEFFKKIGADPNKKLITYGAKIPKMYSRNAEVIETLLRATDGAQLFVRFDPGHDPAIYGDLLKKFSWERAEERSDRDHVANLLYYSDVVVSIGSTFCNEACLVDTPSIWIGFDEDDYSVVYQLELFKRLIATGAIPLAKNHQHLLELVKSYLQNKKLDSDKRQSLIEQEYHQSDGRAGERIVSLIISQI